MDTFSRLVIGLFTPSPHRLNTIERSFSLIKGRESFIDASIYIIIGFISTGNIWEYANMRFNNRDEAIVFNWKAQAKRYMIILQSTPSMNIWAFFKTPQGGFSYGSGKIRGETDKALGIHKGQRELLGHRTGRGKKPPTDYRGISGGGLEIREETAPTAEQVKPAQPEAAGATIRAKARGYMHR
jgi:hypothetical protein